MKKRIRPSKRRKNILAGTVICSAMAITLAGAYTWKQYENRMEEQLAFVEEAKTKEKVEGREPVQDVNNHHVVNAPKEEPAQIEEPEAETEVEEPVQETGAKAGDIHFAEDGKLLWPINGSVLLSYSMDKTIYFSTLDQYKYNPALIMAGAVGDQVISAAKGIVKSIDVTAQTGTTVTVDMGNGYEAVYGQLKDVPVKVGDYVEAKTVLGYLSEPTKYYSVEGCNLYFQILKDAQPVNPLDFLEE